MNWISKQWETFKSKSPLGKFWDVLFVVVIVLLLFPGGRIRVQQLILKTGIMGSTGANMQQSIDRQSLDWQLSDQNGHIVSPADFDGKPIFMNFWATWCPPCRAEMPSIISLMEKAGGKAKFMFITNESPEKVNAFLEKQGWNLPVYFPAQPSPEVFEARSLPTTIIISPSGEIIHRSEGMRNWDNAKAVELLTP